HDDGVPEGQAGRAAVGLGDRHGDREGSLLGVGVRQDQRTGRGGREGRGLAVAPIDVHRPGSDAAGDPRPQVDRRAGAFGGGRRGGGGGAGGGRGAGGRAGAVTRPTAGAGPPFGSDTVKVTV